MSSPTYPIVATRPTTIFRRQQSQASYNLYNLDPANDIYVDDSPQAPGVPSGVPLHPGSQLTWEAGRECYAICATGKTATLLTSPASGSYFDPYTLATNVLTLAPGGQTLAQQIAQAINLVGVPAIDQPVVLYNSGTKTVANGGAINFVPNLDVSKYPSLYIMILDSGAGAYSGLDERLYSFNWLDSTATFFLNTRRYYCANASGVLQMNLRTRSPLLNINNVNTIARSSSVQIVILGSLRTISRDTIFVQNAASSPWANQLAFSTLDELTNIMSFAGTTGAAGTYSQSQNFQVGDYTMYFSTSAATTVQFTEFSGNEIYKWNVAANTPLVIPNIHLGPANYVTNLITTGAGVTYTLGQNLQGPE